MPPLLVLTLMSCLLPVLVAFYARFVEPNRLVVRIVRIDSGRGLSERNGGRPLRVALLSDFHYPRNSSFLLVRRAIAKSNECEPDLVLLLGDFFDKNRRDPTILPNNVDEVFGGIDSRDGVFGVLGNHDHWFDAPAIRSVLATETNIRLIDNDAVCIPLPLPIGTPLYFAGVGDLWLQDVDYERAVANIPLDAAIILLSHNPDVVEDIADPRIVVQFSGHTHGGQVRLPFLGTMRVPSAFGSRYAQGFSDAGNHPLYVNPGICSTRSIRFLCPPEVTWVEIW